MRAAAAPSAVLLAAAIVATGCGSSKRKAVQLTLADAGRIAEVRPVAPGWSWPSQSEQPAENGAPSDDPVLTGFRRATKDLRDLGEAAREWKDADKLAHVDIGVYESAADAHKAFAPFNALSLGWAKRTGGIQSRGDVHGLGDEAWLLRQTESGEQVTYHWRRGNILIETHMHCFGSCRPGLLAATRAWAAKIDAAARRLT